MKEDETKKKDSKQDKVKVAKKIAKDMERWAKTLNQKKENAKSNWNSEFAGGDGNQGVGSGAADAGYAILEKNLLQILIMRMKIRAEITVWLLPMVVVVIQKRK